MMAIAMNCGDRPNRFPDAEGRGPWNHHDLQAVSGIARSALLDNRRIPMVARPLSPFTDPSGDSATCALLSGILPLSVLFMIAFAIAILINYPSIDEQKEHISAHAANVIAVSGLIFAGRNFHRHPVGYADGECDFERGGCHNPRVARPPDGNRGGSVEHSRYVLHLVRRVLFWRHAGRGAGRNGVRDRSGANRAGSLIGAPVHALSPLTASTYLLIGLSKIELGDHQRFSLKWTILVSLLMLGLLIVTGAVPIFAAR
jgi:CitMHS family citrate-Mg2+:H+ or citrate-Ca2+:H+ symporter